MDWYNCCKRHLSVMRKDGKRKGYEVGWCDDADRRFKCVYPGCANKAHFEVYWIEPLTKKELKSLSKYGMRI